MSLFFLCIRGLFRIRLLHRKQKEGIRRLKVTLLRINKTSTYFELLETPLTHFSTTHNSVTT